MTTWWRTGTPGATPGLREVATPRVPCIQSYQIREARTNARSRALMSSARLEASTAATKSASSRGAPQVALPGLAASCCVSLCRCEVLATLGK